MIQFSFDSSGMEPCEKYITWYTQLMTTYLYIISECMKIMEEQIILYYAARNSAKATGNFYFWKFNT